MNDPGNVLNDSYFRKYRFVPNDPKEDPYRYYSKPLVGWLFRRRINLGLKLIGGPHGDLLEIGYGSGLLVPILKGKCGTYHGLDLKSDPQTVLASLAPCMSTDSVKLVKGSALELPYPDASMDCVAAFSVFEHIQADTAAAEIRRVLKPGGYTVIGVPAVNFLMEVLFAAIGYDIRGHHVTAPEEVQRAFASRLRLDAHVRMPCRGFALYHLYKLTA